jgi:UrcA family protein
MVASTSKISNLVQSAGASRANSEIRSAVLVWFVSMIGTAILAFIVVLLGIDVAWSATPSNGRSVTVSYADLDLSSPAGAKALYGRIQAAAKQVCGHAGADVIEQGIWKSCYRSAVGDAVRKVNDPLLTAVHTGKPAAVTAMLQK